MSNARTNINKIVASSSPDASSYAAEKAKWTAAHDAFLKAQARYNSMNCGEAIDITYPPLPTLPAARPSTPTRYAYNCTLPVVAQNPPGLTPGDNPGTHYSDGTPNCDCAKAVIARLEELRSHYLRQQDSVGPTAPRPDVILYNYYVALDAKAHEMQGLYEHFCAINNCPVM